MAVTAPDFGGVPHFLALRFAIAFVSYIPGLYHRPRSIAWRNRQWTSSALLVAVCLSAFYALQTISIQANATNTAFFTATAVLWVPIISFAYKGERPSVSAICGIIVSLIGLGILNEFRIAFAFTDVLGLVAALVLGFEIVMIGQVMGSLGPNAVLPWTALYTGIVAVIFAVWSCIELATMGQPSWNPTTGSWLGLGYCGVMSTAVANWLANWANSHKDRFGNQIIDATHRALIENLDALAALIFSVTIFSSRGGVTWTSAIGGLVVLLGVIISELQLLRRKKNTTATIGGTTS